MQEGQVLDTATARESFAAAVHRRLAQRIAERQASTLPGHLCEQCLDAPAVALVPAPWGGEMGVCEQCHL